MSYRNESPLFRWLIIILMVIGCVGCLTGKGTGTAGANLNTLFVYCFGIARYGLVVFLGWGLYMQFTYWHPIKYLLMFVVGLLVCAALSVWQSALFGAIPYIISIIIMGWFGPLGMYIIAGVAVLIPFYRGRMKLVAAYARIRKGHAMRGPTGGQRPTDSRQVNTIMARPSTERNIIKQHPIQGVFDQMGINARLVKSVDGNAARKYYIQPGPGCKVGQIMGLKNELALALKQDASVVNFGEHEDGLITLLVNKPKEKINAINFDTLLDDQNFMHNPLLIPVGVDTNGQPINVDLFNNNHLLVAGSTGMGKTTWLFSLILGLAYKNTPETLQMMIIDVVKHDLGLFNDLPHLLKDVVINEDTLMDNMVFFEGIINERRAVRAKDPLAEFTPLLLVIDEIDTVIDDYPEIKDILVKSARIARGFNILIVLASQRPDGNAIDKSITCNFRCRVCLPVESEKESMVILGNGNRQAAALMRRGELYFKYESFIRGMGYFVDGRGVAFRVKAIADKISLMDEPPIEQNDYEQLEVEISKNTWADKIGNVIPFMRPKIVPLYGMDSVRDGRDSVPSAQDSVRDSFSASQEDSRDSRVMELRKQSLSIRQIAAETGLSKTAVGLIVKKYNNNIEDEAE